jgi:thymidylate synthase
MRTDRVYASLLYMISQRGKKIHTRNGDRISYHFLPGTLLLDTPLITIRRTAWYTALREMEWFLSGEEKCPEILLKWWAGQLNPEGKLLNAYPKQFRRFGPLGYSFDQISFLLREIKEHPNSNRLILTAWHPADMATITIVNENPKTPTTCHNTMTQFFVRDGRLDMRTYQRSADMLLGVPHNWIQSYGLLLYLAWHTGFQPGCILWDFGDAHIYDHPSHLPVADEIIAKSRLKDYDTTSFSLIYKWSGEMDKGIPKFLASDFTIEGTIPEPEVFGKPKMQ